MFIRSIWELGIINASFTQAEADDSMGYDSIREIGHIKGWKPAQRAIIFFYSVGNFGEDSIEFKVHHRKVVPVTFDLVE